MVSFHFLEAQERRRVGVHFSYSNRLVILHGHCTAVKCVTIKVQIDLNDTRVAAQHGLFLSLTVQENRHRRQSVFLVQGLLQ
jgi:hypothetical protein